MKKKHSRIGWHSVISIVPFRDSVKQDVKFDGRITEASARSLAKQESIEPGTRAVYIFKGRGTIGRMVAMYQDGKLTAE